MYRLFEVAAVALALAAAPPVYADGPAPESGGESVCFQVSRSPGVWARTPELLCIAPQGGERYEVTLGFGLGGPAVPGWQEVARFSLELLSRVRSVDHNRDVFGIANPENSTFNALKIVFRGRRDVTANREVGTIRVGRAKLFYRLYRRGGYR